MEEEEGSTVGTELSSRAFVIKLMAAFAIRCKKGEEE